MTNIKDMVKIPHPIWTRNALYWNFLLDAYEGGIDYTGALIYQSKQQSAIRSIWRYFVNGKEQSDQLQSGNLFAHVREKTVDYNRRLQMSYYYNFCAPIIDIYSNHLFKVPVTAEFKELEGMIKAVGEDIDKIGSSVEEFRKELADKAQICGHCFVIVDSPNIPESEVRTLQDQMDRRAFPYLTIHLPQSIINWALDEYGKPYWVLVRECYDANKEAGSYDAKNLEQIYYRLWTRIGWELYDVDYKLIEDGTHPVGEVPIVCVFDKKSLKARNFLGVSSLADIAFIARDVYNSCSELRQILRDQTFAFLAINGSSSEYSELELGVGKGLLYPEGRDVPQYVSPPTSNAEIYFSHIDRQVSKIFQLAKLDSGGVSARVQNPSAGPVADQQSGISKAWDFNQTNSALCEKAGNLEDGEMKIWRLVAKWQGNKDFTGTINYPDEFSVSSLKEDLDELEQESRLNLGKTFNLEVRKAIIQKKFPNKKDAEIQKMVDEIEGDLGTNNEAKQITSRFAGLFNNNAGGNGGGQPNRGGAQ